MTIVKAITTVGSWTAVSRLLGMIREGLMSHFMGVNFITDAFVIAFKLPNFFRRFFAEGAFNAAFVPLLSEKLPKNSIDQNEIPKEAFHFSCQIFSWLSLFLMVFVLFFELFMPYVISILAPGSHTQTIDLAIEFSRMTFPYIFFISLTALLGGILTTFSRFWVFSSAPALLNITMIFSLLWHESSLKQYGFNLTKAILCAGVLQLFLCYWVCVRYKIAPKFVRPRFSSDLSIFMKRLLPGMVGAGVFQINMLIDQQLASFLEVGSLSYLYYADRVYQLPMSIFGIAVGTALLPTLSHLWQNNEREKALLIQSNSLLFVLYFNLPATVGLVLLSQPIISLLFGHGAFGLHEIHKTAPALAAYAIGLPAYVCVKVLSTTFFSQGDTKTPVKIALQAIIFNFTLNIVFMQWYQHVGLALATSITAYIQVFFLSYHLKKKDSLVLSKKFFISLSGMIFLSLVMGIFLWHVLHFIEQVIKTIDYIAKHPLFYKILISLFPIIFSVFFYFLLSYFIKKSERNFLFFLKKNSL